MELRGPYLVHRTDDATQDVVEAVIASRALYRLDVTRLCHDADL